jgi:hypothetical protein
MKLTMNLSDSAVLILYPNYVLVHITMISPRKQLGLEMHLQKEVHASDQ